jgi:hypothetical protein
VRLDSHGCGHARSERRSNEISRRKCFAFSFVIRRRVSGNLRLRRTVRSVAMQIAAVSDVNFDHSELLVAFGFLSCQVGTIDLNRPGGSGEPPLPLRRNDRSFLNFLSVRSEFASEHPRQVNIMENDHVSIVFYMVVVLPAFIPPAETDHAGPSACE